MADRLPLEEYKKLLREAVREAVARSFALHLLFYVMVNVSDVIYSILVAPHHLQYSLFVMVFWGIGLFFHYLSVSGIIHNLEKYEAIAEVRAKGR